MWTLQNILNNFLLSSYFLSATCIITALICSLTPAHRSTWILKTEEEKTDRWFTSKIFCPTSIEYNLVCVCVCVYIYIFTVYLSMRKIVLINLQYFNSRFSPIYSSLLHVLSATNKRWSYPIIDLDRPWGLKEAGSPKIYGQSAHEGSKVVSPRTVPLYPYEITLVLIYVRG